MPAKKKNPVSTSSLKVGTSRGGILSQHRSLRSGDFTPPQIRYFNIKLHLVEADEVYTVPECHRDLTIKNLKNRLELLAGIPVNFQRLHYLDRVDLGDLTMFKHNDIIPGGTLTMRIWPEDSWGLLVSAAVTGNNKKIEVAGGTMSSTFSTAYSTSLGPAERNEWLAHRTFAALFINARRGRSEAVDFLIQNGADVAYKTPLGRTALHVAVTSGHCDCMELLLGHGAKISDEDNDGYNAVMLARQWGQKECERRLFRYQWKVRVARSSIRIKSVDKVEP
ncbi:ankyrin repeat domain-containing protein 60 [Zootoca vivipara]|uniref:ankyrin repeat domain-containing protein 60 n=1 Tax=Zootoca vivipara TaxID=8524 RepID=UPI001590F715|nr:ankyrin repeat domain-containing protein 60 [Zootoca vivipara]